MRLTMYVVALMFSITIMVNAADKLKEEQPKTKADTEKSNKEHKAKKHNDKECMAKAFLQTDVVWVCDLDQPEKAFIANVRMGLRSDGVVVWHIDEALAASKRTVSQVTTNKISK